VHLEACPLPTPPASVCSPRRGAAWEALRPWHPTAPGTRRRWAQAGGPPGRDAGEEGRGGEGKGGEEGKEERVGRGGEREEGKQ